MLDITFLIVIVVLLLFLIEITRERKWGENYE